MLPEHMESPDPTVGPSSITETGALMASSGLRTGRVPKDKRIVLDDETKDVINWGPVNIPCSPKSYDFNRARATDFLNMRKRIFVIDQYAGFDPRYELKTRIISCRPYHALFMRNMLKRAPQE